MGFPCRFIPRNVFDLATLTTSIAPYATLSVDYLKNTSRSQTCRWPAASGTQSIKGTWGGQGFQVGGVGLDRFNLEPSATVRFRGFQNADWTGTTLIDTGTVPAYVASALGSFTWGRDPLGSSIYDGYLGYKFWVGWFTKQTIASFQIDIIDAGNSWRYIDLARVVLGDYIETTFLPNFGMRSGWREKTEQQEMDGGSLLSDGRVPRRGVSGSIDMLPGGDRSLMSDFTRFVGKRIPFLATFQASEGSALERDLTIVQAKFLDLPETSWDQPDQHTVPFSIVEA